MPRSIVSVLIFAVHLGQAISVLSCICICIYGYTMSGMPTPLQSRYIIFCLLRKTLQMDTLDLLNDWDTRCI